MAAMTDINLVRYVYVSGDCTICILYHVTAKYFTAFVLFRLMQKWLAC